MKIFFGLTVAIACLALGSLAVFTGPARADDINVTIVAGHPPVFRWVKHASQTFIPAVNAALEGSGHSIAWSEQYGGSLAKVGDELETVEEGLAEIGLVSSLFDPSKLSVQNVTYFTPFVSSNSTAVSELIDGLHKTDPDLRKSWEDNGLDSESILVGIGNRLHHRIRDLPSIQRFPHTVILMHCEALHHSQHG